MQLLRMHMLRDGVKFFTDLKKIVLLKVLCTIIQV